ncbi:MAG: Asp-tRNA(Asn)/Glu-tRNA(Gln) amidotransferase subunit GatC [Clostridia bacterium]|nr:Asp-tRNA(Asn)/Glu-tRNA(Gln) amidotransferase subunit GatC [Clostridia bacterium]
MAISKEDLRYLAKLSRIKISEEHEDAFINHLNQTLEYVKIIDSIDTDGVSPCVTVFDLKNVLREDIVKPSCPPEKLLENAPFKEDTAYVVPKVVE